MLHAEEREKALVAEVTPVPELRRQRWRDLHDVVDVLVVTDVIPHPVKVVQHDTSVEALHRSGLADGSSGV